MRTVEQEIADLESQLRELRELPAEPAVGAIVKFTKRLSGNTYSYAALHTDAGWYLTGRDGRTSKSWKQLVQYAGPDAVFVVADGWYSLHVAAPAMRLYSTSVNSNKLVARKVTLGSFDGPDDVSVPW